MIAEDRPMAAVTINEQVLFRLERLRQFPLSGRTIPEFPNTRRREVVVPPFRFFYRIEGDDITVFDVWHEAQLPDPPPTP